MRDRGNKAGPEDEGTAIASTVTQDPIASTVTKTAIASAMEREIVGTPAPDLSVVIPIHNEADNIIELIEETTVSLRGIVDFEIVVVDDGSSDDSAALLRQAAGGTDVLRVVRHGERRGQSAALLSGVRAARAGWIATLDGDGQNDPADIPKLLEARDKAATSGRGLQLLGGRRVNRKDRWHKRASSRIANAVRRRLLGDATPDTGCGLKLFPRSAFLALPHFDHFHRFLPALIRRQGGSVISVPVNHRPRRAGRSHYGVFDRLWVGLFDLAGVMWLQRRSMGPDDAGTGAAPKE